MSNWIRSISNEELADLSSFWENSKVDHRNYYDAVLSAFEVDQATYTTMKEAGMLVQEYEGRYYVAG